MPPKKEFSKNQIIEAAFEVAETEGLTGLTVRKVADRLGSSVAPIYSNFEDVAELKRAVVQRVFDISMRMMQKRYTGDRFLDIGIASIRFAREYSVFFRELLLMPNEYMGDYDNSFGAEIIKEMTRDPALEGFTEAELVGILLKMRIFQLGLSTMVANGLLPPEFDEEAEIALLASTGEDIIVAERLRKDRANRIKDQDR